MRGGGGTGMGGGGGGHISGIKKMFRNDERKRI